MRVVGILLVHALLSGIGAEAPMQQAHVHGVAELNIAVDGASAIVELIAPADSVYGFEHAPETDAQRAAQKAALESLQTDFGSMLVFPARLECQITANRIEAADYEFLADDAGGANEGSDPGHADEVGGGDEGSDAGHDAGHVEEHAEGDDEHSEVFAELSVSCGAPLAGAVVTFGFQQHFPELRELEVQVLSERGQSGTRIENDNGRVTL